MGYSLGSTGALLQDRKDKGKLGSEKRWSDGDGQRVKHDFTMIKYNFM